MKGEEEKHQRDASEREQTPPHQIAQVKERNAEDDRDRGAQQLSEGNGDQGTSSSKVEVTLQVVPSLSASREAPYHEDARNEDPVAEPDEYDLMYEHLGSVASAARSLKLLRVLHAIDEEELPNAHQLVARA